MNSANELTLLQLGEITYNPSETNQLEILKTYGSKAAVTDLAIVTGAKIERSGKNYIKEDGTLSGRTSWQWTRSLGNTNEVLAINDLGFSMLSPVNEKNGAIRPVIKSEEIYNEIESKIQKSFNGLSEVCYGEYPQTAPKYSEQRNLDAAYNTSKMKKTGKQYTFDAKKPKELDITFVPTSYQEYEYNGKKYINLDTQFDEVQGGILSAGDQYSNNKSVWIEVKPVEWLVDESTKTLIAKKSLAAGLRFNKESDHQVSFEKTEMYKFLNNYMFKEMTGKNTLLNEMTSTEDIKNEIAELQESKNSLEEKKSTVVNDYFDDFDDIVPSYNQNYTDHESNHQNYSQQSNCQETHSQEINDYEENINQPTRRQDKNPYHFNFDEVTDEEIIKGCIESDISVFIHGKPGDGKSARVKQYDPDCKIIYISNCTPDDLKGKSVYSQDNQEMLDIPPTWYKNIEKKCIAEPDKIHIIFFDEITNALPSIQGMAFNIILDKEINGTWKLPKNARIVAAGNEIDDSLAANEMAEPLFSRFAHTYVETQAKSWLKWASTSKKEYKRLNYKEENEHRKIHPAIYSYIAYKDNGGEDVLRTPYDGKSPNADPRKWEMASKLLYSTNNPKMLRALVGDELTQDFVAFARQNMITLDDVLNDNYNECDLDLNMSERYATAIGLAAATEEEVEKVRDFTAKISKETQATFESIWSRGEEDRLEIIQDLRAKDQVKAKTYKKTA